MDLSEMNYCDNGNTTFIIKEFTHQNKCKIMFYYILNKTLYILLIAVCLNNEVIYRTVLPPLAGGAISYVIADSGATYNTQKKHCWTLHFARDIYETYDEWLKD